MSNTYLAFDLETHKITPKGADILSYRPLGISCAAAAETDNPDTKLWYHNYPHQPTPDKLTGAEAKDIVEYLTVSKESGFTIVTWNGSFDFSVLADESGMLSACQKLAADSVDIMYQVVCLKGFPVSLNATALGMGLPTKFEDIHGENIPSLWRGTLDDRERVLKYVANDAAITLLVAESVKGLGMLRWITKRGHLSGAPMHRLMSVKEARELPLPDTSWMPSPIVRDTFYGWVFGA